MSAVRQVAGIYSAVVAVGTGAAGYQTHATISRFVPGIGASSSVIDGFTQSKLVRPTVNGPVGVGSASGIRCPTPATTRSVTIKPATRRTAPARARSIPLIRRFTIIEPPVLN